MSFAAENSELTAEPHRQQTAESSSLSRRVDVLLLPPNLVTHIRVILLFLAVTMQALGMSFISVEIFILGFVLDVFDGWLARRLDNATRFGAFYDVLIDNTTRTILWTWKSDTLVSIFPVVLEFTTFICTHQHTTRGQDWKTSTISTKEFPRWIQAVMKNNFRSIPGLIAMLGLFGCPLWFHAYNVDLVASTSWALVLIPARVFVAVIELYTIGMHVDKLLELDVATQTDKQM